MNMYFARDSRAKGHVGPNDDSDSQVLLWSKPRVRQDSSLEDHLLTCSVIIAAAHLRLG